MHVNTIEPKLTLSKYFYIRMYVILMIQETLILKKGVGIDHRNKK